MSRHEIQSVVSSERAQSRSLVPVETNNSVSQDQHENEAPEEPKHSRVWRFVGVLNPETLFRFSDIEAGQNSGNRNTQGVWQSQHDRASYISHDESSGEGESPES